VSAIQRPRIAPRPWRSPAFDDIRCDGPTAPDAGDRPLAKLIVDEAVRGLDTQSKMLNGMRNGTGVLIGAAVDVRFC
jgi:hypothetical protein